MTLGSLEAMRIEAPLTEPRSCEEEGHEMESVASCDDLTLYRCCYCKKEELR